MVRKFPRSEAANSEAGVGLGSIGNSNNVYSDRRNWLSSSTTSGYMPTCISFNFLGFHATFASYVHPRKHLYLSHMHDERLFSFISEDKRPFFDSNTSKVDHITILIRPTTLSLHAARITRSWPTHFYAAFPHADASFYCPSRRY
jgi:hypothetical protein